MSFQYQVRSSSIKSVSPPRLRKSRNPEFSTEESETCMTCTRPRFTRNSSTRWTSRWNRWKRKTSFDEVKTGLYFTSTEPSYSSIVYCYCGEASCGLIFRVRASCTNSLKWRSMPLLWGLICQVHRSTRLIEAACGDPTGRRQPADNPTVDRDLRTCNPVVSPR